jgi:hypothetical protein
VLKKAHIPYILACHLQIDTDQDPDTACRFEAEPDPAYHFDADPDPTFPFDADPDPQHWRIHTNNYGSGYQDTLITSVQDPEHWSL